MADVARAARNRAAWPTTVMVASAIGVIVGALLPWVRSGDSWRSSFAAVRSARSLGVVDAGVPQLLIVMWAAIPFALGLLLLALAIGRPGTSVAVGVVVALVAGAVGSLALLAPVPVGPGPAVTSLSAATLLVASVVVIPTLRTRSTLESP